MSWADWSSLGIKIQFILPMELDKTADSSKAIFSEHL